jgi:hypothetical protein
MTRGEKYAVLSLEEETARGMCDCLKDAGRDHGSE